MKNSSRPIDTMRPQQLMNEANRLWMESGTRFYESRHDLFLDTDCPACNGQGEYVFSKFGFSHRKCEQCGTIFASPRPDNALLKEYYNAYDAPRYWTKLLLETDATRKKLQHRPRVKHILSVLEHHLTAKPARAVDLGAGSGAFSLALQETGCFDTVLAMDLSLDAVQKCRQQGLEARIGSVADIEHSSADYIAMNDIIEHLFNPLDFLLACYSVLTPGGCVSIACPNGEGFDFQIMREETVNIHPPEHLQYFNPHAMEILLGRAGFEIISIETPGMLDVQIVEREMNNARFTLERNDFIEFLIRRCDDKTKERFQRFLQESLLSSHMLAIAQKPHKA